MKFRKFLKAFVTTALLIAVLCGTMLTTAYATDDAAQNDGQAQADGGNTAVDITLEDVEVSPGRQIEVKMSMSGKDIAGIEGRLAYDEAAFAIKKIEEDNLSDSGYVSFRQNDAEEFLDSKFTYASPVGVDVNGVVFTFTFEALEGAAEGTYAFSFEGFKLYDSTQGAPKALTPNILNAGSITVVSGNVGAAVSPGGGASSLPLILALAGALLIVAAIVIIIIIRKKNSKPAYSFARDNESAESSGD